MKEPESRRVGGPVLDNATDVFDMKLQDVMSRTVATCRPEESLHRAAQLMWEGDFGCVIVIDGEDRPIGVLTDRDLCIAAWSQDKPLREILAGSAMGQPAVTVTENASTAELHARLREHQLHRMPIVDAKGHLVGIASHSNLILAGSRATTAVKRTAAAKELLDTLSQIKSPRSAERAATTTLTATTTTAAVAAAEMSAAAETNTAAKSSTTRKNSSKASAKKAPAKAAATKSPPKKASAKATSKKAPAKKRSGRK